MAGGSGCSAPAGRFVPSGTKFVIQGALPGSTFSVDSGTPLDYNTTISLYPSLSQAGRIRGQVDIRLKYELFKDFNAGILLTDTFDSSPPDGFTGRRPPGHDDSTGA